MSDTHLLNARRGDRPPGIIPVAAPALTASADASAWHATYNG